MHWVKLKQVLDQPTYLPRYVVRVQSCVEAKEGIIRPMHLLASIFLLFFRLNKDIFTS